MLEYDSPPFKDKVVLKSFEKKSKDDTTFLYGLDQAPYVLRRFSTGFSLEQLTLMRETYSKIAAYQHFSVPRFLHIRANVFDEVDSRLKAHYLIVEQIEGKNIQRQRIPKEQRSHAVTILDNALTEMAQYLRSIYENGGYYDCDQQVHQYVYGRGIFDKEPKLYYVDLDHRFISHYDSNRRACDGNTRFFETIVRTHGWLIFFVEKYLIHNSLPKARQAHTKLLNYFIQTDSQYSGLVATMLTDFESNYKKYM